MIDLPIINSGYVGWVLWVSRVFYHSLLDALIPLSLRVSSQMSITVHPTPATALLSSLALVPWPWPLSLRCCSGLCLRSCHKQQPCPSFSHWLFLSSTPCTSRWNQWGWEGYNYARSSGNSWQWDPVKSCSELSCKNMHTAASSDDLVQCSTQWFFAAFQIISALTRVKSEWNKMAPIHICTLLKWAEGCRYLIIWCIYTNYTDKIRDLSSTFLPYQILPCQFTFNPSKYPHKNSCSLKQHQKQTTHTRLKCSSRVQTNSIVLWAWCAGNWVGEWCYNLMKQWGWRQYLECIFQVSTADKTLSPPASWNCSTHV